MWLTSRQYNPHPAGAILVMGAAQYNCTPTLDLQARLDQARTLYREGYAPLIVLTGGKEAGDKCTEAQSGAMYLEARGVPAKDIVAGGRQQQLREHRRREDEAPGRGVRTVLLVTDPFHEDRSLAIASDMSLSPSPTPTQTSPITGWSTVPYFFKEGVGVGLGRVIGYNHLEWLHAA